MAFSYLEYLFFVLQIFTCLYYANEESDDVIGGSSRAPQHSIGNNSRNIKGPLTDLFEPLLRKIYSHITSSVLVSSELFHVF